MECKIVGDLLPLYHDEVASEESRALVDEHLTTCVACTKALEDIRESFSTKNVSNQERPGAGGFKLLKKRLRRKTVINIFIAVICAVLVMSALTYGVFFYDKPIPYSEVTKNFTEPINSPIDIFMSLAEYSSISVFQRGDAVYICCTETFWTRYITKPNGSISIETPVTPTAPPAPTAPGNSKKPDISSIPSMPTHPQPPNPLTQLAEAAKVFYYEGNFNELTRDDETFLKASANAILLWEKP